MDAVSCYAIAGQGDVKWVILLECGFYLGFRPVGTTNEECLLVGGRKSETGPDDEL